MLLKQKDYEYILLDEVTKYTYDSNIDSFLKNKKPSTIILVTGSSYISIGKLKTSVGR